MTGFTAVHVGSRRNTSISWSLLENFVWFTRCIYGLLIAVVVLVSSATAEPAPKVCVKDGLSRQVCVSAFPKRVISLSPALTETVFDLGEGRTLVGRTERCNEPPEALKVPIVGAYLKPDLERIISLKPDLVLSPEAGMQEEVVYRLEELGIPVFVDNSGSLDEITCMIEKLGTIFGKKSEADAVVRQFQKKRQNVKEHIEPAKKPLILFVVGMKPLVVAGGKSFIGALVREAGGVNIAEDAPVPYPKFNIEEVVKRDPDLILVLNKECWGGECFKEWQKHTALRAVRNKKVYELDADLVARSSARLVDALEQMAAIFHPELFNKKLSATDVRKHE